MGWLLVVLVALPLGAATIALAGRLALAELASVAAALGCLGLVLAEAVEVEDGDVVSVLGGWLRLDALSAVFLVATGLVYAAAALFSVGYLRAGGHADRGYTRRYLAYFSLFACSLLLVPVVADFGLLWVGIELTTILSALLVALNRTDAALEAAWKYVIIASAGLGIALLGVVLLYGAGTTALGDAYEPRFATFLGAAAELPATPVKLAFLLAAVGFGTKVGLAPMHTWLPDAHSEAPTPVSALLSGALLASAFYAILRFYQVTVAVDGGDFPRRVLLALGTISLLVAALFLLTQRNYKRLLAYSSIEHMGVIALGVGLGAPLAVAGALLHVVGHAAAKSLGFFGAGSVLRRFETKEIDEVEGAASALPASGPMLLAAGLALSGLPISALFRSELQIVSGGLAASSYGWVALLIVLVNVAFLGVVWHLGRMVLSQPRPDGPRGERSWWMAAAMAACLVVVVGLGLHLPGSFRELLHSAGLTLSAPR